MTYSEYRDTYKQLIRRYPDVTALYNEEEPKSIVMIEEIFTRSSNGTQWKLQEEKTSNISFVNYSNIVDPNAVRFFKNLGGYERIITNYTRYGLIPIENISINPARDYKHVRRFVFN